MQNATYDLRVYCRGDEVDWEYGGRNAMFEGAGIQEGQEAQKQANSGLECRINIVCGEAWVIWTKNTLCWYREGRGAMMVGMVQGALKAVLTIRRTREQDMVTNNTINAKKK